MSDEDSRQPSSAPVPRPGTDASESLNDALDDLEDMLHQRHGFPEGQDDEAQSGDDEGKEVAGSGELQYSIPLLSDVVKPATTQLAESPRVREAMPAATALSRDLDFEGAVSRLAERLSSELDVIIQTAIEEALENARTEVAERVRDHLDITLPEMLEELVTLKQRK